MKFISMILSFFMLLKSDDFFWEFFIGCGLTFPLLGAGKNFHENF
jgi:hypothetical protein